MEELLWIASVFPSPVPKDVGRRRRSRALTEFKGGYSDAELNSFRSWQLSRVIPGVTLLHVTASLAYSRSIRRWCGSKQA